MLHKINFLKQVLLIVSVIFSSSLAKADTYTVTNTDDSGAGSLRQAILDGNDNEGPDNIVFNIPDDPNTEGCRQTIMPTTVLPTITSSPVNINGYTQPGSAVGAASSPATLCIEISGELAPLGANGLSLGAGSSGSTIRGLVINRFSRTGNTQTGNAIAILGSNGGHWIAGNYLNTDWTGTATFISNGFLFVGHGIRDVGTGQNIIGHDPNGPNSSNPAADRNINSGAGVNRYGILITGVSSGNKIRGNYIGTDKTGTSALGNGFDGMEIFTANNTVQGNLISGNTGAAIAILDFGAGAVSNSIIENKIGTDVTGMMALGNGAGLVVEASNNTIKDNVIAYNSNNGILVAPSPVGIPSISNSILNNSIFNNSPSILPPFGPGLGIDLVPSICVPNNCAGIGVTLNDPLDEDVGPNNLQNFPVIDVADSFINPSHVQVRVRLDSKPSQSYLIQGFLSTLANDDPPLDYGEGEVLVAEKTVTTDSSGHVDFRLPVPLKMLPTRSIFTVTATDLLTNDTSEFSKWENLDDVQDVRGSPTAYEHATGAIDGDGWSGMSWEEQAGEPTSMEEAPTE